MLYMADVTCVVKKTVWVEAEDKTDAMILMRDPENWDNDDEQEIIGVTRVDNVEEDE